MRLTRPSARLLDRLDRPDAAAEAWKALVQHNSENQAYYKGYMSSRSIDLGTALDSPLNIFSPSYRCNQGQVLI